MNRKILSLVLVVACPWCLLGAASTIAFQTIGSGMSEVGATNAVLEVMRLGSLAGTATVNYTTSNGTALADFDFIGQSGTLTFNPGVQSQTITISALDDYLAEGPETLTVVLSNPTGSATLGATPISYLTIDDNECIPNLVDVHYAPVLPTVYAMSLQPDGKLVVGGSSVDLNFGDPQPILTRLNEDSSVDGTFHPALSNTFRVNAVQIQSDRKILVAGLFTTADGSHTNIARLNPDGSVDTSFVANLPDTSWPTSLAIQADGKIIVGSGYVAWNQVYPFVIRLETNGVIDPSFFPPSFDDPDGVSSLALQADGKILVGGSFGQFGLHAAYAVIRLNTNGLRDPGFATPDNLGLEHGRSVAVQPDGKIIVGGITIYDTGSAPIARLNSDGSLDPTFVARIPNHSAYSTVQRVALQPNGKVIIGGNFSNVEGKGQRGIARLNTDGSLDGSLAVGPGIGEDSSIVYTLALQTNGSILLAGGFSSVDGVSRTNIARLLPDIGVNIVEFTGAEFTVGESGTATLPLRRCGNSDSTVTVNYSFQNGTASNGVDFVAQSGTVVFAPGEVDKTISVAIVSDNLIEADETFSVVLDHPTGGAVLGPQSSAVVTILDDDRPPSNVDHTFAQAEIGNGFVLAMALQPNGKLIIGGDLLIVDSLPRHGVARLNADGTLDPGFDPGTNILASEYAPVTALALQSNGHVLLGGSILGEDGYENGLARLNPDGSLDTNFTPEISAYAVQAIVPLSGGDFLVSGSLGAGTNRSLARLHVDGSRDTNFVGTIDDGNVHAMARDASGRIVIGGQFCKADGVARTNLARLHNDGSLDAGFAPQVTGGDNVQIQAIQIQSDRKILIAGEFDHVNGVPRHNIARLLEDGSLDPSFDSGAGTDLAITALLVQPDGRIVLAGDFFRVNGFSSRAVARLNADGSFDIGFAPQAAPEMIGTSLLAQPDGKILVGGVFCRQGPGDDSDEFEYCYGVIRLNADASPVAGPPHRLAGGQIQLNFSVLPGRPYVLQASTDLQNWTSLQTNVVLTAPASFQFTDSASSTYPRRFFRLLEPR